MKLSHQKNKLTVLLFVCFFVSGCTIKEKAAWLDGKAGELFENNPSEKADIKKADVKKWQELIADEKIIIEKYLEDNNLNRYGDQLNTIYSGGTPLFDEEIKQSLDRFEYIFNNHPEIINILK